MLVASSAKALGTRRCNLLEAATPAEVAQDSTDYLKLGLDGIKLFTGAYVGNDQPVVNMGYCCRESCGGCIP
jgi:hypothetical protein